MVLPVKLETPHPLTASCVLKQYAPVVLKLPDCPPVAVFAQDPPPLLEEDVLELEDELVLEEVLVLVLEEVLELVDELELEDVLELVLEVELPELGPTGAAPPAA
jgi:hypothetical protein